MTENPDLNRLIGYISSLDPETLASLARLIEVRPPASGMTTSATSNPASFTGSQPRRLHDE